MKKWNPTSIYLILRVVDALAMSTLGTYYLVYQVEMVNLDPLQLVLVGTALETAIFTFEVPTGIVADVYSRRLSVILSMLLRGIGLFIEGSIPFFVPILMGTVITGVGWTFISGALDAWLADELGEEAAGRAYLQGTQAAQIGAIIGIILSLPLAGMRLNLPIQAGAGFYLMLAVFLSLFMPEHGFTPAPSEDRAAWRAIAQTFREGMRVVRGRPTLMVILITIIIFGGFTEGYDRLGVAHLIENFKIPPLGPFESIGWFAAIRAASALIGIGPLEIARRHLNLTSHRATARILLIINLLLIGAVLTFALAGSFGVAVAAMLVVGPLRSLIIPIRTAWINQRLDPKVRATVLSFSGQADALGEIAGGPAIGALALARGLRTALFTGGLLLLPTLGLYAWTGERHGEPLPDQSSTS